MKEGDPRNPLRLSVALVHFVDPGECSSRLLALLGAQLSSKLLLAFGILLIDSRLDHSDRPQDSVFARRYGARRYP